MNLRDKLIAAGKQEALASGWGVLPGGRAENIAAGAAGDCTTILSVSEYAALAESREMLLVSKGYSVVTRNSCDFVDVLGPQKFDLIILCQSVSSLRARAVAAEILRELRDQLILRVMPAGSENDAAQFSERVAGLASPQIFLEAVERLCGAARRRQ